MILTDNGSNMLKALHSHIMEGDEGDKKNEEAEKENEEGNKDGDNGEEDEQNDFDTQEIDHEAAFTTNIKKVSCFAHTTVGSLQI